METEKILMSPPGLGSKFVQDLCESMASNEPSLLRDEFKDRAARLVVPLAEAGQEKIDRVILDLATLVGAMSPDEAIPFLRAAEKARAGAAERIMQASPVLKHRLEYMVKVADICYTLDPNRIKTMAGAAAARGNN